MRIIILFLILNALTSYAHDDFCITAARVSNSLDYVEQDFDVINYKAEIEFPNIENKEIAGKCDIEFIWTGSPDTSAFYFHLQDLNIDSCFYNGTRVNPEAKFDKTNSLYYEVVSPGNDLEDLQTLTVYYSGIMTDEGGTSPWGGVFYKENYLYAMGVGFRNEYVSCTRHWLPCYDHPSDKATFDIAFTVPNDLEVASIGLLNKNVNDDNTTWHWISNKRAATYLVTFAVGDFEILEWEYQEIPVMIFTQTDILERTQIVFSRLDETIQSFVNNFGVYPHSKVGFVVLPISGGMEHQSMISYSRSGLFGESTYNLLGAHELAHAWFGNSISPEDFRHVWLNESFATYAESVWMEDADTSEVSFWNEQRRNSNQYLSSFLPAEGKLPLYGFHEYENATNYPATIYNKGSVVLSYIRTILGEDKAEQIFRDYADRYIDSNVVTQDFVDMAKSIVSSEENDIFEWYFDEYVYSPALPELEFYFFKDEDDRDTGVRIVQVQEEDFTFVPVYIEYRKIGQTESTEIKEIFLYSRDTTINYKEAREVPIRIINPGKIGVGLFQTAEVEDVYTSVEPNSEITWSIYPNPAVEKININIPDDYTFSEYRLTNSFGKLIEKGIINKKHFQIDLNSLSNGTYFIKVQSKNVLSVKKFVINK